MQIKRLLNKLKSIVSKPVFWVVLLVLITSVVFIPTLKMKFWWVDDGWDIMTAQKIVDSITHLNFSGLNIIFNEGGGRFRVLYWFYQTFEYLVGGTNPTLHFLVHYLVVLLSTLLIFRIVLRITKSNLSAFVSSILYVLSPINTENLYRLGPQEPLLCLFLIASIYFLVERRTFLSILFLMFMALSKENGFILWIPVFFLYIGKRILFKKRDLLLEKYCLWGLIFSIPFILNAFLRHGGYSGFYTFNVSQIVANFGSYILRINTAFSPLFAIFLATYLFRTIMYFWKQKYKKFRSGILFQAMLLVLFLIFIVVQSPWEFVLERYLMPATVGLVIFMGLEVSAIKEWLQMRKVRQAPWVGAIFSAFLVIFIVLNMSHVYFFGEGFAYQTRFIQSLFANLAEEVPQNGVVLMNFLKGDSTMELVAQTKMQLGLLYGRPDVQVSYLSLDNLAKGNYIIVGTAQIRPEYPRDVVEKSIGKYRKDENLAMEGKFLVLTTPMGLFKQVTKKLFKFVVNKEPFTTEGIYTFSTPRDFWYKYYVGK